MPTIKNLIYGFALAFILLPSCDDEEEIPSCESCNPTCISLNEADVITNDCIDNWSCNFSVIPQSKVSRDEYYGFESGIKNVFQIINSTEGDSLIRDDEWSYFLVFEIDASQNSFAIEESELELIQASFRRCCRSFEFKEVRLGCLQGEKLPNSENWSVQGNLKILYNYPGGDIELKFDSVFFAE